MNAYVLRMLILLQFLQWITAFGCPASGIGSRKSEFTMKIFDWKRREEFSKLEISDG